MKRNLVPETDASGACRFFIGSWSAGACMRCGRDYFEHRPLPPLRRRDEPPGPDDDEPEADDE